MTEPEPHFTRRLKLLLLPSVVLAISVLFAWNRVVASISLLQGSSIRLYVTQFRNALLCLPLFLLWLHLSRTAGLSRRLDELWNWWQESKVPLYASPLSFFAIAVVASLIAYQGIPKADAVWVAFQAKIFSLGRLFAPAPIYHEFFSARTIVHDGRWLSYTSPGHSLLLVPGILLGVPWLIGPIVGALTVWVFYVLARDIFGEPTARIALLLAATSPFMILLFGSMEFHVTSLFFTALSLYFANRSTRWWQGALAGLALGMVFLTRPFTAIGVGLPVTAFVVLRRAKVIPSFLVSCLAMVALHLAYNHALTGNFLTFPYQLMGNIHGIGFSPDFGDPSFGLAGHSVAKALINLGYNLFALSLQLFGWLFLSAVTVVAAFRSREVRRNWILWLSALGLIAAYLFYWFHGVTPWGPKYWSEALPCFVLLSGAALVRYADRSPEDGFVKRALPFLLAYSLLCYLPVSMRYLAHGDWGEKPVVAEKVRSAGIVNHERPALVFVHTDERSGHFDYTSAFIYNDPLLKGKVVYARDLGAINNARLATVYPERDVWLYDFNTGEVSPYHPE